MYLKKYDAPRSGRGIKPLIRLIVIVTVAFCTLYLIKMNRKEVTVEGDTSESTSEAKDNSNQNKEVKESVKGESSETYSIDSFFEQIRSNHDGYDFTLENCEFTWTENSIRKNVQGKFMAAQVKAGDINLESDCREYLFKYGFEVDEENAGGSDGGESYLGFQNGDEVCLIETKSSENIAENLFKVSCGIL